jgi:uncharacterized protein
MSEVRSLKIISLLLTTLFRQIRFLILCSADDNMTKASQPFQIFVKPVGALCNLGCSYCYYLGKKELYPAGESFRMADDILEKYIIQHINASPDDMICFSWHGGEPTLSGIDFFRKIVTFQHRHLPSKKRIINGIQTNGTLLNEEWGSFLAKENFFVGISIDGPAHLHNIYRRTGNHRGSFEQTIRGYRLLQKHRVPNEILCVVNSHNVKHPLQVYRFFRQLGAEYISFLPLVVLQNDVKGSVSNSTVPAYEFGEFLCSIFDEWQSRDIGKIKVQLIEESARTAFGKEHTLCILKETCGGVPVIEHNGDFYSCDHFVNPKHNLGNINTTPLVELLENKAQKSFGQSKLNSLPQYCLKCEVRTMCNGGCMKDRFILTPDGEAGLNYLCSGLKLFFNHCQPFVTRIAELWHTQNP